MRKFVLLVALVAAPQAAAQPLPDGFIRGEPHEPNGLPEGFAWAEEPRRPAPARGNAGPAPAARPAAPAPARPARAAASTPSRATRPVSARWAWMPPPEGYRQSDGGWEYVSAGAGLPRGWVSKVDPPPGAPGSPEPGAKEVAAALDTLDARAAAGVDELRQAVAALERDARGWDKLDRSVAAARRVNAALLDRSESLLKSYDDRVAPTFGNLKAGLTTAPDLYRAMAADRRQKARAAAGRAEQLGYETQADFCEAAAGLCGRRLREVFEPAAPGRPSQADELAANMAALRTMVPMHKGWAEVLDAWPSSLDTPQVADMLAQLRQHTSDLIGQQEAMGRLTDALKAKAAAEGKR